MRPFAFIVQLLFTVMQCALRNHIKHLQGPLAPRAIFSIGTIIGYITRSPLMAHCKDEFLHYLLSLSFPILRTQGYLFRHSPSPFAFKWASNYFPCHLMKREEPSVRLDRMYGSKLIVFRRPSKTIYQTRRL